MLLILIHELVVKHCPFGLLKYGREDILKT